MADGSPHRRGGIISEQFQVSMANAMAGASGQLGHYYKSKLLAGAQLIEAHQSRFYTRAQAARETLQAEFENALDDVDLLLYPSAPAIAPKFEEIARIDMDFACNTRQATVTRLPAITLPYGEHRGMPTSIQLVGTQFEEAELLALARSVREAFDQTTGSD